LERVGLNRFFEFIDWHIHVLLFIQLVKEVVDLFWNRLQLSVSRISPEMKISFKHYMK